jgi:cellulose synthase operon protein C
VPLGEGRGSFVADRSKSARAAVDLLVALGRPADAARVARRSRARVLSGVERALRIASLSPEERNAWEAAVRTFRTERAALDADAASDWKLPADEVKRVIEERKGRERTLRDTLEKAMAVLSRNARLDDATNDPPLAAGDLELVIHPGTTGWTAIARDASGSSAYALPAPAPAPTSDRAALGKALFDPLATRIDRATRLRVHAYGAWRRVDVHALPYKDEPLVARIAVDYPVGLGAGRGATSSDRVLVVGDPNGDLPSARDEARAVAETFEKERVSLFVRDDATAAKISGALREAGTFHYAGHGVYSGLEGWESALPLASGGRLGVADVLALAPAPARVVLSGCDSAKSEGEAEGLGLAQAFVAAGSTEVLAPVRPVPDELAAKLAARIHEKSRGRAPLAIALRDAVSAFRKEDANADWAAFRVVAR